MPVCPPDVQDAAELYARKSGRHARVHFVPVAGWFVRFELRQTDPAMRTYLEGRTGDVPTEDSFFHVKNPYEGRIMSPQDVKADSRFKSSPLIAWHAGRKVRQAPYLQLDILQMGASGVTLFLEREDTWSGRGEFASLPEATKYLQEKDRQGKASLREHAEDQAGRRAKDLRRVLGKIPFLRVLMGTNKRTGQ